MTAAADPARRSELAAIHTGKSTLGLDDDAYRDLVQRVAGRRSAGDLDQAGRRKVIEEMRRLGFKPAPPQRRRARGRADRPQHGKIVALWRAL